MKRLLMTVLAVLLLIPAFSLAAQDDIDIPALGDQLAGSDPERLLMRLNTPIPNDLLGEEFANARQLDPNLIAEQRDVFDEALDGLRGSMIYNIEYMPSAGEASPVPEEAATPDASPSTRGSQALFSSATLTYLLLADPVDTSDMETFGTTMQSALGSEAMHGDLELVAVNDAPAVLISNVALVNDVEYHTQWIALPVGNVVVVAMVIEGSDPFDAKAFRQDNEVLVMSGIAYLDAIVNG